MTKQHFDTEAVIISKMQEALTQIYQRNNLLAGLIVYRCAQAIRNHWNKLHKRSQIILGDVLQTAIENYNSIHDATITVDDFQNRLQACKRKCTCN